MGDRQVPENYFQQALSKDPVISPLLKQQVEQALTRL
jgi:hypothetical protein